MNIALLKDSKFLKKEDCGPGILVTIRELTQENVAKEGAPEELKWALHFEETDKPMILNNTNGQIIASITGSPETDDWAGHKIVLFSDPNVSFGGKLIGGIRARAPKVKQPAAPMPKPATKPATKPAPVDPGPEPGADDVPY